MGVLHWGMAESVGTKQSAWYDHTIYKVPVSGQIDTNKIHSALDKRFQARAGGLWGSSVGGFCSVSKVMDNGDGTVNIEVLYHIGD